MARQDDVRHTEITNLQKDIDKLLERVEESIERDLEEAHLVKEEPARG